MGMTLSNLTGSFLWVSIFFNTFFYCIPQEMATFNDLSWSGDKDIERIADLLLTKIKVVSEN